MNITKDFLNTIFVDYQEDMAVQIYDEKFAPNPVGYYALLAEVDAALEKPNNADRWTILDRIPYMESAVTFDPNSYAAQQKFFATDNREFSTLADALEYNRHRVHHRVDNCEWELHYLPVAHSLAHCGRFW